MEFFKRSFKKTIWLFNEKLDARFLLILVLGLASLSFQLTGNEENYLACAKQWYFKDWMPQTSVFGEFAGTRLLFQFLFGWTFRFLSFEQVALLGRFLTVILISFPLARIAAYLKISNLVLLLVVLLWFPIQSLYAGGWMIGSFETKVFAYIFSLWAIYFQWIEKYNKSILFQVLAFYFHVLVGGWLSLILFVVSVYTMGIKAFTHYIKYAVAVLPFVIYMAIGLLANTFDSPNVNLDWVYAYFRNPHHIAPFKSTSFFFNKFFDGIWISAALSLVHWQVIKKSNRVALKNASFFCIILFAQQLVSLGIAYFDTNGVFLKTYPFRPVVIFYLFSLLVLASLFLSSKERIGEKLFNKNQVQTKAVFSIVYILLLFAFGLRLYQRKLSKNLIPYNQNLYKMADFMDDTPRDSRFMYLSKNANVLPLPRMSSRDFFVLEKFVPTEKKLLYEWYNAVLFQRKVKQDLKLLESTPFDIDYLITDVSVSQDFLELVYQNGTYFCYQLATQ